MRKRFVAIWFRHLITDWLVIRGRAVAGRPCVITVKDHGRMVITSLCAAARRQGIFPGMPLADARAICADLQDFEQEPNRAERLLKAIGHWCIRYTPVVAVDPLDGLILDATGCSHLWGGEQHYLHDIVSRLTGYGYDVRAAIADTTGTAWAVSRFGADNLIVASGEQLTALLPLPAAALRLDTSNVYKLQKLGLHQISSFIHMPRSALRRRFGESLLQQIDYATGKEREPICALVPPAQYEERLTCLEPIKTRSGIEIALKKVLVGLCTNLQREGLGTRQLVFKACRMDGKIEQVVIGTNRATTSLDHLYQLFENKLQSIEPALGIDVFILEATVVEDNKPPQQKLWTAGRELEDSRLSELLDKFTSKGGPATIQRFLPAEHHWPERSIKRATSLNEASATTWRRDRPRPMRLLPDPVPIQVTAPVPDYPPMLFRYKGKLHTIKKADTAERIEREWWTEEGHHRDYYVVEDEEGQRYWLFRSGHYSADNAHNWFLHGFFA